MHRAAGARRSHRLRGLVLVDSLGLARFRPSLRFALGFLRFTLRPSERSFETFLDQCAHDRERLQQSMGEDWTAFVAYNLGLARSDQKKAAGQLFRRVGTPRIAADDPARDQPAAFLRALRTALPAS